MTKREQETWVQEIIEAEGDAHLLAYVDTVDAIPLAPASDLETVNVKRDIDGNVVVATTQKLPNLRFRLGDLLLDAAGTGVGVAGSLDSPLKLALVGLRFLRTVRKLSTIDIRKEDAAVLIALYRLSKEEDVVRVEDVLPMLPDGWHEAKLAQSLEKLDELGCIELSMAGIVLNETIMVKPLD